MSSREAGFAAVDVVVAAMLVALIAAISFPGVQRAVAAFNRNGAARDVVSQIRHAQSLAVNRGGVFAFQWGGPSSRPDSEYRVVRDTDGSCSLPATDAAKDGTNVVQPWTNLADTYPRTRISTIRDSNNVEVGSVMFNSRGIALNTCASVSFPLTVTIVDAQNRSRQIQIRAAGGVRLQ